MNEQIVLIAVAIAATMLGVVIILQAQRKPKATTEAAAKPAADKPSYALGPQTDSGNMAINALAIKLRAQVISTRWFSEMLLYKQKGKLNFAQMEMLNQINSSCRESCKLLNEMFDAVNTQVPGAVAPEAMAEITNHLGDEQPDVDAPEQQPA